MGLQRPMARIFKLLPSWQCGPISQDFQKGGLEWAMRLWPFKCIMVALVRDNLVLDLSISKFQMCGGLIIFRK